MDIRQKLLHNEIQHVGQIVQVLSYDLIVLQDFIKEQFGSAYDAFYKNHSEQTDKSEKRAATSQQSSSKSSKITVTARKSTAPVPKKLRKRKIESDTSASDASEEDCPKDNLKGGDGENDSKPSVSANVEQSDGDGDLNEDETSMDVDFHTSDLLQGAERIDFSESTTTNGRQRKAIWGKYVVSKLPNGKLFARCKNCDEPVSSKVDRLENHYAKCVRGVVIKSKSITNESLFANSDDRKAELEDQKLKVQKCIRESYKKVVKTTPTSESEIKPYEFKPRGRQDDPVWTYFNVVLSSAGRRLPTCKRCGTKVSGKVERVRKHFIACHELDKFSAVDNETGEDG